MRDSTAWPHIHVSHVATQTDAQDSSTVAVLHRKIARPNKVDVLVSI
jgi:UTP:GlnB (protein PII) uridylyltransferase